MTRVSSSLSRTTGTRTLSVASGAVHRTFGMSATPLSTLPFLHAMLLPSCGQHKNGASEVCNTMPGIGCRDRQKRIRSNLEPPNGLKCQIPSLEPASAPSKSVEDYLTLFRQHARNNKREFEQAFLQLAIVTVGRRLHRQPRHPPPCCSSHLL